MSTSRIALACEGIEVDSPGGWKAEKLNWTELTLSWELSTSGPTDLSEVLCGRRRIFENYRVEVRWGRIESFNFLEIKLNELLTPTRLVACGLQI